MEFPWEVIRKAHANGFMNVDIPAEYGELDKIRILFLEQNQNFIFGTKSEFYFQNKIRII